MIKPHPVAPYKLKQLNKWIKFLGIDFFTSQLVKSLSKKTPYFSANICSGLLVHVKLLLTDNKGIFIHTNDVGSSLVHATKSLPCSLLRALITD